MCLLAGPSDSGLYMFRRRFLMKHVNGSPQLPVFTIKTRGSHQSDILAIILILGMEDVTTLASFNRCELHTICS